MADQDEADDVETPVLRPLVWLGNSRRNVQAFPVAARKIIGDELQLIQFGGMPKDAKPFQGVGSGVLEIALRHAGEAYRTVLAVQLSSKQHDGDPEWLPMGSGPWDRSGRDSWVDLERVLRVHPDGMRREACALDKMRFNRVVHSLQLRYGWS